MCSLSLLDGDIDIESMKQALRGYRKYGFYKLYGALGRDSEKAKTSVHCLLMVGINHLESRGRAGVPDPTLG